MAWNLLTVNHHPSLLGSYAVCRPIPLNKDPGVRPIGVGEVLRQIIGKAVSWTLKEEFCKTAGPLQICAGHSAGVEAAIRATAQIFVEEGTDEVLLIDARNAFNCMNRQVAMHNIQVTCVKDATYIINAYRHPSRLFICGGGEMREGAKFIETGAGHSGTGAMTFFSTVSHGALTYFHPEDHGA